MRLATHIACLYVFLIFTAELCTPVLSSSAEPIKTGIFQNRPLVYYENGPAGLFVEILNQIAKTEGWTIEYVTCNFKECLESLKNGEFDLITSRGETPERLEHFVFSKEPVWTFWGTIYSHDRKINSIFDLKEKKIGVRRKNKITVDFKKLVVDFELPVEFVGIPSWEKSKS